MSRVGDAIRKKLQEQREIQGNGSNQNQNQQNQGYSYTGDQADNDLQDRVNRVNERYYY